MIYLWINGKRIDSINLLRGCINEWSEEEKRKAFKELWNKYTSGHLAKWLSFQDEMIIVVDMKDSCMRYINEYVENNSKAELKKAEKDVITGKVKKQLIDNINYIMNKGKENTESGPEDEKDNFISFMNIIFNVDKAIIEKSIKGVPDEQEKKEETNSEKLRKIEKQSWYKDSEAMKDFIKSVDLNRVVVEKSDFNRIVEEYGLLYKSSNERKDQVTVYLCNMGENFTIDDPGNYRHLRILGCGKPTVRFGMGIRGKHLDMEEHDLTFEDVILRSGGMILEKSKDRLRLIDVNK